MASDGHRNHTDGQIDHAGQTLSGVFVQQGKVRQQRPFESDRSRVAVQGAAEPRGKLAHPPDCFFFPQALRDIRRLRIMPLPEQVARQKIDAMLLDAGWTIQNFRELDLAAKSVALREVPLKSGRCDYLLLLNRKPVGVVEAKKVGTRLSKVAEQSRHYGENLPDFLATDAVFLASGRKQVK